jgi:Uma2 family endonuclease
MDSMVAPAASPGGLPVAPGPGAEWGVEMLGLLPQDGLRYEILDGILLVSPSSVPAHQRVIRRLFRIFSDVCPADHEVFFAPLDWQPDARTSLQPDLMVVARNRIGERVITGNPALVVEVLSPSSSRYDRVLKFSRYAEAGIAQYWIVDPASTVIEVFDLDNDRRYRLAVRAGGDVPMTVAAPLAVSLIPAMLFSD